MTRRKATGKGSKPQQQAASEATSQNAQVATAGSEQEPATSSTEEEADDASEAPMVGSAAIVGSAGEAQDTLMGGASQPSALRLFSVLRPLNHDGEDYVVGSSVPLSREQFIALKAATVVDGEWPEEQEA